LNKHVRHDVPVDDSPNTWPPRTARHRDYRSREEATLDAELEAVGLPRAGRNCRCTVDPVLDISERWYPR